MAVSDAICGSKEGKDMVEVERKGKDEAVVRSLNDVLLVCAVVETLFQFSATDKAKDFGLSLASQKSEPMLFKKRYAPQHK